MEGMLTGLRSRLRRALQRVEHQHQQIREVGEQLERAIASGSPDELATSVERLREALRAHFDLEEDVLFPAVHGLMPQTQPELFQLERDHGAFLEVLHGLLAPDAGPPSAEELRDLRARLAEHERHEERMMTQALEEADQGETG